MPNAEVASLGDVAFPGDHSNGTGGGNLFKDLPGAVGAGSVNDDNLIGRS